MVEDHNLLIFEFVGLCLVVSRWSFHGYFVFSIGPALAAGIVATILTAKPSQANWKQIFGKQRK